MAAQTTSRAVTSALVLLLTVLVVNQGPNYGCEGTPADTSVLLGWKSQIQDPQAHLTNWVDSSTSPCGWAGILCEGFTLQVVHIDVSNMSLSGAVAPIMGQLRMLESFNVATNNFTGDLPTAICSWSKLHYLFLGNNSFTGTVPGCLSQIEQLWIMDLSYNSFDSLPAEIGLFSQLSYLNVEGCALVGSIPPEIGNITTLTSLILDGNQLTGSIPPQLGQLHGLQRLQLGHNILGGKIPSELGLLHSLKYLNLAANSLTGSIPSTLGNLSQLQEVKLSSNYLFGMIPAQIGNASDLITLDISTNLLTGSIPEELGNLKSLRVLNLSMNALAGQIPPAVASVPGLQVLSLSSNQLTGSIPQDFGVHSRISTLDLSSNFLVGPIPPSLCSSGDLSILMLAFNFLSGSIPVELQQCQSLQRLSLTDNVLSGTLPDGIGALPELSYLDLSWTGLSGALEGAQFGDESTGLKEMYLQGNQFNGNLPDSLGLILNLAKLDLSHNMLSGDIPPQLGNCTLLSELSLGYNNFSGSIPSEISNSKQLQTLNIQWNSLTGSIPSKFGMLQSLEDLDLSNNQLNGTIPIQLANISSLAFLNLSHNNLTGPVPVDGVFQTVNISSLEWNTRLCGGVARLKLPPCDDDKLPTSTKIVIAILVVLSALLFAFAFWWSSRPVGAFHDVREERHGEGAGPTADAREMPGWEGLDPEQQRPWNPEGDEELTVFHRGSVAPVLVEEQEDAMLAPHNSPASTVSLKHWQPPGWPWKLILLVEDLDLTEAEVVQTCTPRNLIVRPWSGEMYSGLTKNGHHFVVEKLVRPGSGENLPNFLQRLGQFRHSHIVKILGYCLGKDDSLMTILHKELGGGNLRIALQSGELSRNRRGWGFRFEIALGIVRALHYLHNQQLMYAAPLHAEITSTNVILDRKMKPYLGVKVDLSELDPQRPESSANASGQMWSTSCTDGTDVYQLGVVLIELLSGRPVVAPNGMHIVKWFTEALEMDDTLIDMIDPTMGDHPSDETLNQIDELRTLAVQCINPRPEERPSVELVLQYVLRVSRAARGKRPAHAETPIGNQFATRPPRPPAAYARPSNASDSDV